MTQINMLFICSRNQWRSPTAEAVWQKFEGVSVRSAGTSSKARRTVTAGDIRWADVVFVMEKKHQRRLMMMFSDLLQDQRIEILDIPDEYQFMDPELVETLEAQAEIFFDSFRF